MVRADPGERLLVGVLLGLRKLVADRLVPITMLALPVDFVALRRATGFSEDCLRLSITEVKSAQRMIPVCMEERGDEPGKAATPGGSGFD